MNDIINIAISIPSECVDEQFIKQLLSEQIRCPALTVHKPIMLTVVISQPPKANWDQGIKTHSSHLMMLHCATLTSLPCC